MAPRPETETENGISYDILDKQSTFVPTKEQEAQGVPAKIPSLVALKKVIPSHVFKGTLSESIPYVIKDYMVVFSLWYSVVLMESQSNQLLTLAYYPIYWFLQGTMLAGIAVLGHDCGHDSFSKYEWVNDIFGNILHSSVLLPYYPWKLKHRHHHRNTGNIDTDNVWNPVRESESKNAKPQMAKLWNPFDPFFAKHVANCLISLALISTFVIFGIVPYAINNGIVALVMHYVIPLIVFVFWFSILVFLQHHDNNTPWYGNDSWDYVRGLLSSIDRHYGFTHEMVHNIGTHQVHHMFAKIPHYHLEAATVAFRANFPDLIRVSDENPVKAFLRIFPMWKGQHVVPDDVELHLYKDVEVFEKEQTAKKSK